MNALILKYNQILEIIEQYLKDYQTSLTDSDKNIINKTLIDLRQQKTDLRNNARYDNLSARVGSLAQAITATTDYQHAFNNADTTTILSHLFIELRYLLEHS